MIIGYEIVDKLGSVHIRYNQLIAHLFQAIAGLTTTPSCISLSQCLLITFATAFVRLLATSFEGNATSYMSVVFIQLILIYATALHTYASTLVLFFRRIKSEMTRHLLTSTVPTTTPSSSLIW